MVAQSSRTANITMMILYRIERVFLTFSGIVFRRVFFFRQAIIKYAICAMGISMKVSTYRIDKMLLVMLPFLIGLFPSIHPSETSGGVLTWHFWEIMEKINK